MHIPDGFLDVKIWAPTAVISICALSYASSKAREALDERQLPALGVMCAFIFAGQMINFPVAAGASGHLLGAALATIILGPWSACLILATVLAVQSLFFQDGGIIVLGANIFNMAVVAVTASYYTFRLLERLKAGTMIAGFVAAWLSIIAAAVFASFELAISGTAPLGIVLPAMTGWHALIGIGEGIITAVVVAFVRRSNIFGRHNNAGEVTANEA
ncbi:MAG: energy-coupling factor ABC transporter permease [Bacillota bacterium]